MGRRRQGRNSGVLGRIVRYAAGLVTILLAVRFVMALVDSGGVSGFRNLISTLTAPLVSPFAGLVHYAPTVPISGSQVLTLIAIVAWLIVAWLLTKLVTLGGRVSY